MANDVSTYLHDGMELPFEDWSNKLHSFNDLTSIIQTTHDAAFSSTVKAINRMQTMRNWLIGYYIVEFEQHGKDRAEYGTQLLKKLEEKVNRKGVTRNTFQSARNFYRMYPQIIENFQTNICPTVSCKFQTSGKTIISKLSYSHINEIMKVSDPLARYFYEQECIKCTWSVREHDLEDALISHLQEFILELGKGFCFEARQKRIIIDDEYYYPDLVFYNRILHCGVIIELKNEEFSYENFGQLNAYVSHYRENEMRPGDNPPIGILLCTRKGKKMVEYALAGMDNNLFVSTYMLQLPDKKTLEEFLLRQLREQEG